MPSLRYFGTAVLGSTVAASLMSYVEWGHTPEARLATVTPASLEMMQLIRDEHGLVADMLKVQIANRRW